MPQLNVSDLNFDSIKANLIAFLSQQEEFADYNFSGSALSTIVDLLAYNTHYNGVLATMLANEMFIDSAIKRSSVVSIAKALGYTPTSTRSAKITANITVTPSNTYTSNIATLSKNAIFKGVNDSGQYTFYALEDSYADRVDNKFIFNNVELVEGKQASQSFVITSTNLSDAFPLSNKNVDTTTLSVYVQKSATEVVFDKYVQLYNILDVKNDSLVYFIEENGNGTHELRFGDNILGKQLVSGNIVYVTYHVSSGVVANGSTNIAINGSITGTGETITLSYSGKASGGADAQSIDSIRNTAPKFNATKNRAVTADDYGALIKSRYSNINSITIWGGEDNDPPIYGKVFISIEPLTGSFVTTQDKHDIVNDILKPRGVVGIQPVFVDPEYTYLSLDVVAKYDTKKSTLTPAQVKNSINDQINSYFINDLATKNKKNFYYSELLDNILNTTASLYSVNLEVTLNKRYDVYLQQKNVITALFNTELRPGTVVSGNFLTILPGGQIKEVYLKDEYTEEQVSAISMYLVDGDVLVSDSAGTVDYVSGTIKLPALYIESLSGNAVDFRLYVKCAHASPDIIVRPINVTSSTGGATFAVPSKNSVIAKDESTLNSVAGHINGVTISVVGTNR